MEERDLAWTCLFQTAVHFVVGYLQALTMVHVVTGNVCCVLIPGHLSLDIVASVWTNIARDAIYFSVLSVTILDGHMRTNVYIRQGV